LHFDIWEHREEDLSYTSWNLRNVSPSTSAQSSSAMRYLIGIAITLGIALGLQFTFVCAQDDSDSCIASGGGITGTTPDCDSGKLVTSHLDASILLTDSSGWCRYSVCASEPLAYIGDPCEESSQCVGVSTFNGYVPECGSINGEEDTCGGDGATCVADNGDNSGPSPICSSGPYRFFSDVK
jgi:hypothetical protein